MLKPRLQTNYPSLVTTDVSASELTKLLKHTADVIKLDHGAPSVRQTIRNFFKEKQDAGLEILNLLTTKHQELMSAARILADWVNLKQLSFCFGGGEKAKGVNLRGQTTIPIDQLTTNLRVGQTRKISRTSPRAVPKWMC